MKKNNSHKNKAWTQEEDRIVAELVEKYGTKHWAQISSELHQNYGYKLKSGKQCRERWHNHLNPTIVKKAWTKVEEEIIFDQHRLHGNKWTIIAEALPGRTDNSIKNHFYSTIRRCLRRMSKLVGSKNSTIKMRNVKPSTLSTIFCLAQGKQNQTVEKEYELKELTQINFKELAAHILDFSKWKPSNKNQKLSMETTEKFENMLQSMHKINELYEEKKLVKAKERKEKLLEKKFDEMCSDEEEEDGDMSEEIEEKDNESQKHAEERRTEKNRRKINPPKTYQPEIKLKNEKKQKIPEMDYIIQEEKNEPELLEIIDDQFIKEQQSSNKMEFDINLEEEQKNFMGELKFSPGFFSLTPPGINPNHSIIMNSTKEQVMKNSDCNEIVERLRDRITQNISGNPADEHETVPIHSPGSAFKYYS